MQLNKDQLVHVNSVTHAGKILVVATFSDGSLQYTVRQDGFEQSYLNAKPEQRIGWENWKPLPLPDDAIGDPSVAAREQATLTTKINGAPELLMRSVYQSKQLGAVVPVQLVSTQEYLYIFRQSVNNTLLVDRFIFDGMSNELKPKLEVRYRRSRQKYSAQSTFKRGTGGKGLDTLDFTDMSGAYFYEPTTELCLLKNVQDGRFAVAQVPTTEHDKYRWHIFIHRTDSATGRGQVEHVTLRSSDEGIFDLKDYTVFESGSAPRVIPGILRRTIDLTGQSVANGPAATLYDIQREATNPQTNETYLLRTETRLMLAIPTDLGVTALSFAIAGDGTLSQMSGTVSSQTLRSEDQVVLLPLSTLDQIVARAAATPPPEGTITGMAEAAIEIDASGRVVVSSPQAGLLSDGDRVQLSGTTQYDGTYQVTGVSGRTFQIAAPFSGSAMGTWKKEVTKDALIFDGRVSSYQLTADGKLAVDAINHQLQNGDRVQIVGSISYDGTYPITKLDDSHFVINAPWQPTTAQNVRLLASRRRGIVLDGANDYIELPNACLPVGPEITISFWARGGQSLPNQSCVFYAASGNMERSVCIHAPWDDGVIYFDCGPGDRIEKQGNAADFRGRFTHWAFTKNVTTGEMKIYLDGALWHSGVNKKAPICAAGAKVNFVAAARMQPGLNADYHYDGCLSDLQIWSRALSADEIQSVMYAVPSPNDADLMGHWPLGAIIEGTPRTVLDFSVHGNDGILRRDGTTAGGAYVSAVSLPRTLSSAPPDATTTPTSVLNFDGRDDYVALPAMNIDWSQGLTIEAWVRYESFNQYSRIVDFSNGAGNANIIVFNDQNHPTLGAQNLTSQGNPRISLDNSLQAGVWTHVAVTVEKPGIGKLYKNGQVITSGPLLLPDNVNRVNCWIAKSAWGSDGYFQGQMAELRVWKTPRTQADIQRDMGQRLTGAEDGLVGYWPLDEGSGGIASDRVRRSGGVGSLPGTISGATWQSASWPLDRPAVPAPPPISVVKYDNSDLFPVAANATYREEFEFKIDAPYAYNPYNIDGGYPIFQFSYWGRRNRSSEGAPTIIPAGTPSFTDVGGGWWRASCQVTIPAGIGFLRLFEIANFTWPFGARGNLEVRKHKISLTSEAITEEQRIETVSAAAVPVAGSAQQKLLTLQRTQRDLAALEQQEGRLLLEQAALEVKKARIRDLTALTIDTVALTQKVEGLKREAQRLLDIYNNALANPLNYFCTLQVQLSSGEWQWVTGALYGFVIPQATRGARVRFTPAGDLYRLSFEVAPNDWHGIRNAAGSTGYEDWVYDNLKIGGETESFIQMKCQPTADGTGYRLAIPYANFEDSRLEVYKGPANGPPLVIRRLRGATGNLFKIVPTDEHLPSNDTISKAQSNWEKAKAEYESWAGVRDSATGSVAECDTRLSAIRSALAAVQSQLAAAQTAGVVQDLNTLNSDGGSAYFAIETLPPDSRGLSTQRASLPFVSPGNRLTALQTCEGYVQVTYVDEAGRMRQTVYHAAADSKVGIAFEKWFPEPPRGCANLAADRSVIKLNQPLTLAAEWTLEAWFYYPLPPRAWNVIATSSDGQNSQLVIREGKYLGSRFDGLFISSGHSLEGLCPGWHHVALVKRGTAGNASLRYYLDGDPIERPIPAAGSILTLHGGSERVTLLKDSLPTGDALTFCVFAKGNAMSGASAYLLRAKNAAGADVLTAQLQHGDSRDRVVWSCDSDTLSVDIDRPRDDEWTHWTFTKNLNVADGTMIIYRNGRQIAAARGKSAKLPTTAHTLTLGEGYAGSLLEPSLWGKTMWAGDIAPWLGQIATGTEDKLCGVWRFEGKVATDRSAKKKHGTLDGTPTLTALSFDGGKQIDTFGNILPGAAQMTMSSVPPNAVTLNGSSQVVELPMASWPGGSEVTVCFYSKGASWLPAGTSILCAIGTGGGRALNIHLPWSDGNLYFDCGGDRISQSVPSTLYKGAWTHWAFTKNVTTGEMKIYANGELFASGTGKTGTIPTASRFTLGANTDNGTACYYPGQVTELHVWSKVLNQTEIRFYKDNSPLGTEPNLAAYFRFNSGGVQDLSASQRTGQYVGGPTVASDPALTLTVRTPGEAPPGQQCGKLAEIRVWSCALSSDEINANSVTLPTGREPGLQAYYGLRTMPGGVVWGQTEFDPDATFTDGSFSACSPPVGNPGNAAVYFQGIEAHVSLPELSLDSSKGFTAEAWVLCDKYVPYSRILDFGNGAGADNILLFLGSADGSVRCEVYRGGSAQGIEAGGVLELGRWTHIAVSISAGNEAKLYKNGVLMNTQSVWSPATVRRTSNYLGRSNWAADKYFDGQLAEIRIWGNVRSIDDLRTNLHRSLLGKEDGLQGYWPLDTLLPGSITKVRDHSTAGAHGSLINGATVVLTNALPVGVDAVVSAEYTTLGYDPQDPTKKQSMMRRFFGGRVLGAALLLPDKRVEAVDLKWVGNGQFAPTLLGYIEGAPPVPSENLTEGGDYKSATSVELSVSSDVEYSWSRSQSAAMGGNLDLFLGVDTQTMGGLGVMEQLLSVKVGAKGSVNYSKEQSSSTNITSSSSQTVADRLELRGTEESSPAFPQLGTRFVPRNVGYALVISSLADVYVSRLKKSGRMVGYTILPVEGIPPDVNTITFLMNPAYVMQGSLDGMVGSRAASPRFYRDVPEMRTQYGSLYPASYYRIEEAYALKEKIEAADKERAAYFAQFSVSDPEAEVGVDLPTEKPSASAVATVLGKIKELGDEASQKLHASTAFLSWQKKMEDMLVRSGKRNIVNTYVWDADGGLHTDQQSFANTVEHTIGGSFNLDTSLGLEANVTAFGVAVDCTALMNSNLTQSISKTERSSTAVQLNVDLSGVESAGITDETERPLVPGEKVDRYRFMTFYLEGSTDNYNEFFQRVVDPEWLQMNSEEARALRQARGKANKTWRVLHRVTYVERPVLEGGVRGLPVAEKEDQVTKGIMDYFDELGLKNQMFETQLTRVQAQLELSRARSEALDAKLNQILALLTKA